MKFRVKVEEQWYEVEIKDLTTQPVIAYVDGESLEVWPESSENSSIQMNVLAEQRGMTPVEADHRGVGSGAPIAGHRRARSTR